MKTSAEDDGAPAVLVLTKPQRMWFAKVRLLDFMARVGGEDHRYWAAKVKADRLAQGLKTGTPNMEDGS